MKRAAHEDRQPEPVSGPCQKQKDERRPEMSSPEQPERDQQSQRHEHKMKCHDHRFAFLPLAFLPRGGRTAFLIHVAASSRHGRNREKKLLNTNVYFLEYSRF